MTKIKLSQSIKAKLRGSSPGRSEGSLHNRDYFIAFFGRAKGRRRKKLCTIVSGAPHSLRACFHYLRKNVKITPVLHATLALEQKEGTACRRDLQSRLILPSVSPVAHRRLSCQILANQRGAEWRVECCSVPRPHYSARTMHFRHVVQASFLTEMHWLRRTWKMKYIQGPRQPRM